MRVLTFQTWAPYAHFRRPYTTRSPATFSVPPRSTILGMLGAILGLGKKKYPEVLAGLKIGVKINGELRKVRTTINLMDTKENKMIKRTQMLYEFISDPEYIIAVHSNDNKILEELFSRIKEHKPYYTPYLGTAQHIARIYAPKIQDQNAVEKIETTYVAPINAILGVENGKTYIVERQTYHIDAERRATKYVDIAIPMNGPITVRSTDNVIVTDGGIVLW